MEEREEKIKFLKLFYIHLYIHIYIHILRRNTTKFLYIQDKTNKVLFIYISKRKETNKKQKQND